MTKVGEPYSLAERKLPKTTLLMRDYSCLMNLNLFIFNFIIIMRRKFTILMFGLLLAVGWTIDASAQKLEKSPSVLTTSIRFDGQSEVKRIAETPEFNGKRLNAPRRSASDLTAYVTHEKSWYENLTGITWTDLQGNTKTTKLTEPVTDANGMIALLTRIYTDKNIPGTKYSAPQSRDIPYQTIQYGWDINGTNYQDAVVAINNGYILIRQIIVTDPDGRERYNVTANANNAPTGFGSYQWDGYYYWAYSSGNGTITIPASYLQNNQGYSHITVRAICASSSVTDGQVLIGNDQFGLYAYDVGYSSTLVYSATCEYDLPGTIEAPTYPGYTVLLVKLNDGVNEDLNVRAPMITENTDSLRNYFTKYVSEIQLLTDGLRVNQNDSTAGTLFAYTGDLNKFFYISKGKMAFLSSLDPVPGYDKAPFYSMYEEFSPAADSDTLDYIDFYEQLKQGTTYSIVHDCNSVEYYQHYFSMSGKKGRTTNRVNSLVLYIPDYRGGTAADWRTYVKKRQPTVGMYMIDLYADIEPSTITDYYTVTVDWTSNLDNISHSDGIDQTYKLYEIYDKDNDGDLDTTLVYTGPNVTWTHDYPVGDPSAYDISYYVIGTPTAATNQDTFFAKSNTDDVTVPGKSDFLGLQWWRYESDYVTDDGENQEVNYYRNWLAPHALSVQGETGITAGNVGTTGRTLTLYRDDNKGNVIPVMDLELVMDGNKAYYRIKKRPNTQVIEPGYDENGEKNNN